MEFEIRSEIVLLLIYETAKKRRTPLPTNKTKWNIARHACRNFNLKNSKKMLSCSRNKEGKVKDSYQDFN